MKHGFILEYTNVTSPYNLAIFYGTQQEKIMGLEGVFDGFGLWEMKFLNILVLAIKSCKILWVPKMPGTQMLWVHDFFFF
jgi:hypothetical protein